MKKINWALWAGFLLSVFAFLSYPLLFVWFPVTRDFPWANLLLFVIALVLLVIGVRRAFSAGRSHPTRSKIAAGVLGSLTVAVLALFVFSFLIMARWLPASHGAPQVGQKAPDFSLADTSGRSVSLTEILAQPINGRAPRGALLIFYRGYW
jgi:type VI protein secretion system component VasK